MKKRFFFYFLDSKEPSSTILESVSDILPTVNMGQRSAVHAKMSKDMLVEQLPLSDSVKGNPLATAEAVPMAGNTKTLDLPLSERVKGKHQKKGKGTGVQKKGKGKAIRKAKRKVPNKGIVSVSASSAAGSMDTEFSSKMSSLIQILQGAGLKYEAGKGKTKAFLKIWNSTILHFNEIYL